MEFSDSNEEEIGIYRYVARGNWGATGPLFLFSKDLVANLKKKIHLGPVAGTTGGIFKIFQNGHIFLKF